MILVSACLLGVNCRYDGDNSRNGEVLEYIKKNDLCVIPACPEQLGGLPTPRDPSTLPKGGKKVLDGGGKVVMEGEKDVTDEFKRGAEETLELAKTFDVERAILKNGSPSCGKNRVSENFEGEEKERGVTAALLMENGIEVLSEEEI